MMLPLVISLRVETSCSPSFNARPDVSRASLASSLELGRSLIFIRRRVGEEAKILGEVDNATEILAVLEYLRDRCYT